MHVGQKFGIFPFSPQLLECAPAKIEAVYLLSRKQEVTQAIFEMLASEDDMCLNDVDSVILPDKICPFGCKKEKCIYDFDITRCPHNLDEKSLDELSEYLLKLYYHDKDGDNESMIKKIPKDVLDAVMKYNTPGNYGTDRQNNNPI